MLEIQAVRTLLISFILPETILVSQIQKYVIN